MNSLKTKTRMSRMTEHPKTLLRAASDSKRNHQMESTIVKSEKIVKHELR